MKKFVTLLSALLLCVCFLFAGCGKNLEMPTGDIKGNGGNSLIVGDYVYFANTYVSSSSLSTGQNDEGKVGENAIYRVKTNSEGLIETSEDEDVLEQVLSKIAGFEASNMFAKGEYLYFTSPNTHKSSSEESQGKDRFDLTTLFRCKLNGTGLKEILTTQTSAGKFYLAKQGEQDILYFFDDNKLQAIEIADKLGNKQVLASDVADVVFPEQFGETLTDVFYTAELTEEDGKNEGVTGNKLYRYNLADKTSTNVYQKLGETVTLVALKDARVYYTKNDRATGYTYYYSNNFAFKNEVAHTYFDSAEFTEFYTFGSNEEGELLPVVFVYNSKFYMQPVGENPIELASASVTVEFISGEYIYYTMDSGIYRKSYFKPTEDAVQITDKTNIQAGTADFDGRFIYFYAQTENNTTNNYYMFRANTKSAELGRMKTECLSYVLAEDLAETEEVSE